MGCANIAQLKKNVMSEKTNSIDLVKKATETNGCNLSDFAEPQWNKHRLEKDIILLESDIYELRKQAFAQKNKTGISISGVDIDLLQAKISRLDSMKVRLESLELINKKI